MDRLHHVFRVGVRAIRSGWMVDVENLASGVYDAEFRPAATRRIPGGQLGLLNFQCEP
jgi:hypothetical protein